MSNGPNSFRNGMFVLSDRTRVAQAYYDLSQQSRACNTTYECCLYRNASLGSSSERYFNPKCVNGLCEWNFTEYPRINGLNNSSCSNSNAISESFNQSVVPKIPFQNSARFYAISEFTTNQRKNT